eukprot:scaffold21789_cov101-Isochrysis_galbana.AAC.1
MMGEGRGRGGRLEQGHLCGGRALAGNRRTTAYIRMAPTRSPPYVNRTRVCSHPPRPPPRPAGVQDISDSGPAEDV